MERSRTSTRCVARVVHSFGSCGALGHLEAESGVCHYVHAGAQQAFGLCMARRIAVTPRSCSGFGNLLPLGVDACIAAGGRMQSGLIQAATQNAVMLVFGICWYPSFEAFGSAQCRMQPQGVIPSRSSLVLRGVMG